MKASTTLGSYPFYFSLLLALSLLLVHCQQQVLVSQNAKYIYTLEISIWSC
uniref:Uncharacterized protein n=1 Tax=Arundo donax TaxID=35708 RepID=A0A0A9FIY1_ARUDO